jgi:hypothetical protein
MYLLVILYGASVNISRMYYHQGATLVAQSSVQTSTYVLQITSRQPLADEIR